MSDCEGVTIDKNHSKLTQDNLVAKKKVYAVYLKPLTKMFNSPVPSKWAAPSCLRLLLGLLGFSGFLGFLGFVPFLGLAGQDKGGILGQRRGGDPQSISAISINQFNPNSPVMRSSFVETGRIRRGFGAGVSLGENLLLEALDLDGPDVPGQGDGLGLEWGLDIDGIRVPSVDHAWAASGKVSARVGLVVIRPVEGARGTGGSKLVGSVRAWILRRASQRAAAFSARRGEPA